MSANVHVFLGRSGPSTGKTEDAFGAGVGQDPSRWFVFSFLMVPSSPFFPFHLVFFSFSLFFLSFFLCFFLFSFLCLSSFPA